MNFRHLALIGIAGLLMRATAVFAAPPHDGPPGPPREAIEACSGKKAGDAVTVKMPDGRTMKAICTLIAVPADRERPPMGKDRPPTQK